MNNTKIKPATESNMRDIKAALAVVVADAARDRAARIPAVMGVLFVEKDEARDLIARGRWLVRRLEAQRLAAIKRESVSSSTVKSTTIGSFIGARFRENEPLCSGLLGPGADGGLK